MKFNPKLLWGASLLLGFSTLAQAQTQNQPTQQTRKVHAAAPEFEVARGTISASPSLPLHTDKDLPHYKELQAWAEIGARMDGETPPPAGPPEEGTWAYYLGYLGGVQVLWDGTLYLVEGLNTIIHAPLDYLYPGWPWVSSDSAAVQQPGANKPFNYFVEGNLNTSVDARWKNGDPVFPPGHGWRTEDGLYPTPVYTWSAVSPGGGPLGLYVASDSTNEQKQVRALEPSTQSKELHFDFGPEDEPTVLDSFPRTTTVVAEIADPTQTEKPPVRPLTATVTWHLRPTTLRRLKIKYEAYEDGAPIDISEQIYQITKADKNVVTTGAQLTKEAINALYIQPAEAQITGPLLSAGFHAAGTLLEAATGWGVSIANKARAARALKDGVDESRVSVEAVVTLDRVKDIGTVLPEAAAADAAATATETTSAMSGVNALSQNSADVLTHENAIVSLAQSQEQLLRDQGKIDEADQIAGEIRYIKANRAQSADSLDTAQTSVNEAQSTLARLPQEISGLAQMPKGANLYPNLTRISGLANGVGSSGQIASNSLGVAAAGGLETVLAAQRIASILEAAGLSGQQLTSTANLLNILCQAKTSGATDALASCRTLADRNADKLFKTGCFVAGTLVATEHGLRPIETLQVGERVWSRDAQTGKTELKPIARLFQHHSATLVLTFSDGQRIETTQAHPFYVQGRGFVPAGELGIGTSIVTRAGPALQLTASQKKDDKQTVYNFEVQDFHTYFVGNDELWVHNDCEIPFLYLDEDEEELFYAAERLPSIPNWEEGDGPAEATSYLFEHTWPAAVGSIGQDGFANYEWKRAMIIRNDATSMHESFTYEKDHDPISPNTGQQVDGLWHAGHAEPIADYEQRTREGRNFPIAVNLDMCQDCRRYFRARAIIDGVRKLVRDPKYVWIFRTDGNVVRVNRKTMQTLFIQLGDKLPCPRRTIP